MENSADRAFIFDVFGTLVDWRSSVAQDASGRFAARGVSADPHAFADDWRNRYQPAMESVRNGSRPYVPIDVLHREMLDETLAVFEIGPAFSPAERDDFARTWERLNPWPEVVAGLDRLRKSALIAPCSNGSTALMARLARHAGFSWDAIVGADTAQMYKPKPEVYLAGCAALGFAPEQVTMVAAHNDDLVAAPNLFLAQGHIRLGGR